MKNPKAFIDRIDHFEEQFENIDEHFDDITPLHVTFEVKNSLKTLNDFIAKNGIHNVILKGFNSIYIHNSFGVNEDHRGSDHCEVKLPQETKVRFRNSVSLYDFIIGFIRIKSHKFDTWYELLTGVDLSLIHI